MNKEPFGPFRIEMYGLEYKCMWFPGKRKEYSLHGVVHILESPNGVKLYQVGPYSGTSEADYLFYLTMQEHQK
jgi:hypothetical protein